MNCSFPNVYYEPLFTKCRLRYIIYELIVFKMVSDELILLPTVGLCNGCYETNCHEPEFMKHGGFGVKSHKRDNSDNRDECSWSLLPVACTVEGEQLECRQIGSNLF